MRALIHVIFLAMADYRRERLMSACAVLGLTAVLAPLLILYGVKFGVMTTLTKRLLSDPATLEVTPVVSGRYTSQDVARWRALPGVSFVLPRTRNIAATMTLTAAGGMNVSMTVSMEPTAADDPVLKHYGLGSVTPAMAEHDAYDNPVPDADKQSSSTPSPREEAAQNGTQLPSGLVRRAPAAKQQSPNLVRLPSVETPGLRRAGCVITTPVAEKLGVTTGDAVLGRVERSSRGEMSSAYVRLDIVGVLPLAASQKPVAYVPLKLLVATEDFRDFRAVPDMGSSFGWDGESRPPGMRLYPSFRLYAATMDDVARLRDYFLEHNIETNTQAASIDQLRTLETGLNIMFGVICITASGGFFTSTLSSILAGIKRKERTLGLLQLTGFSSGSLALFPLTQALMTALWGSVLAIVCYAGFSELLNSIFAGLMNSTEQVCRLEPLHYLTAMAVTAAVSLLAALVPAVRSTRIEPSEVIRDV